MVINILYFDMEKQPKFKIGERVIYAKVMPAIITQVYKGCLGNYYYDIETRNGEECVIPENRLIKIE